MSLVYPSCTGRTNPIATWNLWSSILKLHRKAFPLGLSILWQHQQQRLVGTCTNWLNHGPMEPRWLLIFNSLSHRATGSRRFHSLWAFRATCDAAGVVPKEGVQIPLRPLKLGTWCLSPARKSFGGWAHCGMVNKLFAEAFLEDIYSNISEVLKNHIYTYIYIYIYMYILIHIYIYIIQIRKVSLQILVDHRYSIGISSRIRSRWSQGMGQKPGTLTKLAGIAGIYDCSSPQLAYIIGLEPSQKKT